jgi:hypothetical protein
MDRSADINIGYSGSDVTLLKRWLVDDNPVSNKSGARRGQLYPFPSRIVKQSHRILLYRLAWLGLAWLCQPPMTDFRKSSASEKKKYDKVDNNIIIV